MKPSEIISLARRQTGCTEDIVTPQEAYHFLNFVIEDFGAEIRASDSGHGFDYLTINVQAGQPSYPFTKDNGYPLDEDDGEFYDNFPIGKLEKVWYRLKNGKWRDLDIRFVDKIDVNDFPDQGEPEICFITNNYLNLVPIPKEATIMQLWGYDYNPELSYDLTIVAGGSGNVKYTRSPDDDEPGKPYPYAWASQHGHVIRYTANERPSVGDYIYAEPDDDYDKRPIVETIDSDKEENIFIDKRWHYILVEGLKYRMYGNMGVNFETARTNSRAFYDSEKIKAIQNIVDRGQLADTAYFPDLNFLNY